MPDNLAELRDSLIKQMQRQDRYFTAGRAVDLPAQVAAPLNALAASTIPGIENQMATGYDTVHGTTVVPFTWGLSTWNGGDVWSGS